VNDVAFDRVQLGQRARALEARGRAALVGEMIRFLAPWGTGG
jgi:hypothetical protein